MKSVFNIIKSNPLFKGIAFSDYEQIFACLSFKINNYKKGDFILHFGDKVHFVGIIISGAIKIIKDDYEGNSSIIAKLSKSEIFAETFACANILHSPVTVQASEDCEILLIDYRKIIYCCSNACEFHTKLIENMLNLIAIKNLKLSQKIEILSKRTTREKLLMFLDLHSGGMKKFTITFNREELAQYLCVDRSAMSNELSKMRDEGLIRFKKSEFEFLN